MINLIIKGSISDAITAASSRGILLRDLRLHDNKDLVLAITSDKNRNAVIEWFCIDLSDRPFAPGSLLHYTRSEEDQFIDDTDHVVDLSADMIDG